MTSLHVTVTAVQDSGRITSTNHVGSWTMDRDRPEDSRAKKPSSSSLRVGAGNGAPGGSCVGSLTDPASPKGFNDCSLDSSGFCDDVLTGTSASRRDQPMEFNDSRKDVEAMSTDSVGTRPLPSFPADIQCTTLARHANCSSNERANFCTRSEAKATGPMSNGTIGGIC